MEWKKNPSHSPVACGCSVASREHDRAGDHQCRTRFDFLQTRLPREPAGWFHGFEMGWEIAESRAFAQIHLAHRRRDDVADAEHDGRAEDADRDVLFLADFLFQVERGDEVKKFEPDDREHDADKAEYDAGDDSVEETRGMPRRRQGGNVRFSAFWAWAAVAANNMNSRLAGMSLEVFLISWRAMLNFPRRSAITKSHDQYLSCWLQPQLAACRWRATAARFMGR